MSQDTVVTVLPSTGRTRFLDACYRRQPDATAVWFMRQAGRSFAQYRQLRKKYGILEIAQTPELSTQVTLMPVHTFGVEGGCRCRPGFREVDWGCEPKGVQVLGPTLSEAHLCSHEGDGFALSPLWHGHGSRVRGDDRGRWRRDPCGLAR